jgi:hypothetical protein
VRNLRCTLRAWLAEKSSSPTIPVGSPATRKYPKTGVKSGLATIRREPVNERIGLFALAENPSCLFSSIEFHMISAKAVGVA